MGIYRRKGTRKIWMAIQDATGKWRNLSTGFDHGQEAEAQAHFERLVRELAADAAAPTGPLTVRAFAKPWLEDRKALDLDWKNDKGALENHILPRIGDLPLREVRTRHILDLIHAVRTGTYTLAGVEKRYAPRTVYNVYSVVSALFRDAKLADHIEQTPCVLRARQLGSRVDSDPGWRSDAVFTRPEVEILISDDRIPSDRRVVYALELLAGVRPGETAALRWRHYDATMEPLGRMLVAFAYNTRKNRQKSTKTDAVKHVPVHPTLAAILAEWKLSGWAAMMGRAPEPDDLIVPLPPAAADRRRSRKGEPFRGHDYSGKRWREEDLPALGWRARRHYDMRATFITLAIEDGADEHILESRVTHTKKSRSAFTGYDRGRHWQATCAEVAKLKITRRERENVIELPMAAVASGGSAAAAVASSRDDSGTKWRRRESNRATVTLGDGRILPFRADSGESAGSHGTERHGAVVAPLQTIDDRLEDVLATWRRVQDRAGLRRDLLALLNDLDG